ESVPAGTKITDPEKYFAEIEWPASLVAGNFIVKGDDLRGKVVQQSIAANLPPTKESFEDPGTGQIAPRVAGTDTPRYEGKQHMMTFQVGASAPWNATYR